MKREITISSFAGPKIKATIFIDKNGLRVEDKTPLHVRDSNFIRGFLTNCLDMDSWKHSWHMDVSLAQFKNLPKSKKVRKKIREIFLGKIEARENEIQKLKDAIQVLGKWN